MTNCDPLCKRWLPAESSYGSNRRKSKTMDQNTMLGSTTGAAVMFGFGIVWLLIGLLRGCPTPAWLRVSLLFGGIVLGTSIVNLGFRVSSIRQAAAPVTARQLMTNREIGGHFYLIFGGETAAIFLAVVVLRLIRYANYILCGIALIVGVHFIPLAALFQSPVYYGTGLLGCTIGVAGFFVADDRHRQRMVGLWFGSLLWATAAWITWQALAGAHHVLNNLPPA